MEIHVFSRVKVETGIPIKGPYVVISIRNTGEPRAKVKKQLGLRDVLYLEFSGREPMPGVLMPPEIKIFTPAQADKICKFVHRHKADVGAIVVHCEQGTSRSPAVAAAISDALGLDAKRFWQLYTPNKHVYHLVSEAFERGTAAQRASK